MVLNFKKKYLIALGLFVLGVLFCIRYASTIIYDADMSQLLDRAQVFQETGRIVPYGNVASSGVKVYTPGSFLSVVVALPMYIWNSPYSALFVIGLLHFFAMLLILRVLKDFFDFRIVYLLLIFYWCNPWQTSEVFLWNPAYLYFFTALHFWSAYQIYKGQNLFWTSLIHVLSIFGALQSHSSFVILGFISVLLFWKKALKISWSGVGGGFLLGIASLIPYFIERLNTLNEPESMATNGAFLFRGLVYVYPLMKGVWYWFRQGSFVFPTHILNDVGFNWISEEIQRSVFKLVWFVLAAIMTVTSLIFSIYSNMKWGKENNFSWNVFSFKKENSKNWIGLYIYSAIWALLFASALIPAEMAFWHVLLLFPIAVLIPIMKLYELWDSSFYRRHIPKILIGVVLYFSIFTMVSSQQSRKHKYPGNLVEMYELNHQKREVQ